MEEWRLRGQENYLSNVTLYRVQFPEFWKYSYETKNPFFQKIAEYANDYVKRTGKWAELLEGEKIQHFWHEHCEFCWEKAYTNKPSLENGYDDFCEDFEILCGASSAGKFQIYHDGALFVFDAEKADGTYTHWHPSSMDDIVEDIRNFMQGNRKF